MNGDTNKHKPLSREELFRLLETKDEPTLPEAGLDDFEKEALEGFSTHSSVEKARTLTNEIDVLIHEKVNEKKASRPVPRVIWFSAAASVLVLIILSFYFLTETTGNGKPELALNNKTNSSNSLPEKEASPVVPPAEVSDATILKQQSKKEVVLDELQQQVVTAESKKTVSPSAGVLSMNKDDASTGTFKGDALEDNLAIATKDSKAAYDKKQHEELSNPVSEKSKFTPAPAREDEDLKQSVSANGAVAVNSAPVQQKEDEPATTTAKPGKEQETIVYESAKTSNAEAKQAVSTKRKKEAEADQLVVATGTASQTKEERNSPSVSAGSIAYFAGGEEAVKAYVVNWLKKQHYKENDVLGTYSVRMTISANGTVSVISIDPEKNVNPGMTGTLKKALNDMDGWKPAMINGTASASEVVVHLAF